MKLARDTWLTFQYEAGQLVRSPVSIAISLLQPITFLLLFTPFLKSVMGASTYVRRLSDLRAFAVLRHGPVQRAVRRFRPDRRDTARESSAGSGLRRSAASACCSAASSCSSC